MSLYNTIKKYTEQGKLVVTRYNYGDFYIYSSSGFGVSSDNVKEAYEDCKYYPAEYREASIFKNETLLGFYNPDTEEVEAIDRNSCDTNTAKGFQVGDKVLVHNTEEATIYSLDNDQYVLNLQDGSQATVKGFEIELLEQCQPTPEVVDKLPDMSTTIKKGFDPETLTFDCLEIKEGDDVEIYGSTDKYVVFEDGGRFYVEMRNGYALELSMLNITAHYSQKSELEELEEELEKIRNAIVRLANGFTPDDFEEAKNWTVNDALDRYYQARKSLEEFKSNNQ